MSVDQVLEKLHSPVTREALAYWQRIRGARLMPARRDLDPAQITGILPHVMLIQVLRDPIDFRYRLMGTYLDDRLAQRYTGRRAREFEDKGPGSALWERLCEVVESRSPVACTLPYTGPDTRLRSAEEVMLPLSEDGMQVTTIFSTIVFTRYCEAERLRQSA